ncbi:MAG: hypothetical protein JNK16_09280 [Phycisphaerales bacterium]|nr:hypothetical protein [Phycisphaerales bacterium]
MARRICSPVTRKQIIDGLASLGAELGRTPSKVEYYAKSGSNERRLKKHFGTWNEALRAADLRPNVVKPENAGELLDDWGKVARAVGRCPKLSDYPTHGTFGVSTLRRAFKSWRGLPRAFYARSAEDERWKDVIKIIRGSGERRGGQVIAPDGAISPLATPGITYGEPLDFGFLRNAPVNEAGVVYLFGCLAARLGYIVEAIQTFFPDCEAKRRDPDGRIRRVRIEFEFESRNFLLHGHDAAGCDVIVCWRDNWEGCPLHVVDLSVELQKLKQAAA